MQQVFGYLDNNLGRTNRTHTRTNRAIPNLGLLPSS